jgi:hypothetical protein
MFLNIGDLINKGLEKPGLPQPGYHQPVKVANISVAPRLEESLYVQGMEW